MADGLAEHVVDALEKRFELRGLVEGGFGLVESIDSAEVVLDFADQVLPPLHQKGLKLFFEVLGLKGFEIRL